MRRWKVDTHSKLDSVLMLSSVNLPGGELVRNLCRNVSLCMRKQTVWVSGQVRHKPACTVTGAGLNLEIFYLRRKGITLSME